MSCAVQLDARIHKKVGTDECSQSRRGYVHKEEGMWKGGYGGEEPTLLSTYVSAPHAAEPVLFCGVRVVV